MNAADVICAEGAVRVRRFAGDDADFALIARWVNEPHVREWWDPDGPPATADSARRDYGTYTDPASPGASCFIELDERPVGFLQFYPWSSETDYCRQVGITVEPTAWAFDVFIGDPAVVGTGVATRALDKLCRHLLDDIGASAVVIVTETGNVRAHHVYEKLGFVKERDFLDTDTRGGERVRSYLMRKPARTGR